jgi:hypothetical protein
LNQKICLLAAASIALALSCRARTPAPEPALPCALAKRVELRGFFVVEYGDPPAGSSGGLVRYVLATDQGTAKRMVVEAQQLEALGPVQSIQGRRVIVTADTMIGRKDTLQVCAIRLES